VIISIEKSAMHYKIVVPKFVNITELGISSTPSDYIVESQILDLDLINKENIKTIVLYEDMKYAILKSPYSETQYYIVDNKGRIQFSIDSYLDCETRNTSRHLFNIYFVNDFIVILHKAGILLYNIPRGWWWNEVIDFEVDFCGYVHDYYYLKKCQKIVFILSSKSIIYNIGFIIIDLEIINTKREQVGKHDNNSEDKNYKTILYVVNILYYKGIKSYLLGNLAKILDDIAFSFDVSFIDYSLDVNNGVLYLVYKLIRLANDDIVYAVIEYNLCNKTYKWREFRIDVPINWCNPCLDDKKVPVYISHKRLASKRIPKYLPMYSLRSLYNIITNKLSQYGLVIEKRFAYTKTVMNPLSHLEKRTHLISLDVIDSKFNRISKIFRQIVLSNENIDNVQILVRILYQDVIGIYHMTKYRLNSDVHMIDMIIINELSIVNEYNRK